MTRYNVLPELHADLFSRHARPLEVHVFVAVDQEMEMLNPTRFVVDAAENGKEGDVAAEVCSSKTGL